MIVSGKTRQECGIKFLYLQKVMSKPGVKELTFQIRIISECITLGDLRKIKLLKGCLSEPGMNTNLSLCPVCFKLKASSSHF